MCHPLRFMKFMQMRCSLTRRTAPCWGEVHGHGVNSLATKKLYHPQSHEPVPRNFRIAGDSLIRQERIVCSGGLRVRWFDASKHLWQAGYNSIRCGTRRLRRGQFNMLPNTWMTR